MSRTVGNSAGVGDISQTCTAGNPRERKTSVARPRIWYLATALSVGGAERRLVDLANGLNTDQYDITVVTLFDHNPLADKLDEAVTFRTLGGHPRTGEGQETPVTGAAAPGDYFRLPLEFIQLLRRERPDILHSFLFYDNIVSRIAGLVSPETTVITEALGFQNTSQRGVLIVDRLTRHLSDRIVTNSESGGQYFAGNGIHEDRVEVIPGGRDLSPFQEAVPADLEGEFGISHDAPVVGTVGRMVTRKGHTDLLEAWETVHAEHPDAHLVLVGDGPRRASLEEYSRTNGVDDSIHFPGIRTDTPALLSSMDVFAFPSYWEGLPGALIEAMASSTPIVATHVEGNEELIDHDRTGLLVPSRSPDKLTSAISLLLTDRDLAERLGLAARREVEARFTKNRLVADMESLYAEVNCSG